MTAVLPKIIAVSGKSGSGMTTLCDELVRSIERSGKTVRLLSCRLMSDRALEEGFGLDMHATNRSKKKFTEGVEGKCWHYIAADIDLAIRFGRSQEFVGVALKSRIVKAGEDGIDVVVVDDLRYIADKLVLDSLGARCVRLAPSGGAMADKEHYADPGKVEHECLSETELDDHKTWLFTVREPTAVNAIASKLFLELREYLGMDTW